MVGNNITTVTVGSDDIMELYPSCYFMCGNCVSNILHHHSISCGAWKFFRYLYFGIVCVYNICFCVGMWCIYV